MWIFTDPALGEYIPKAPVDEEARKYNQNLPGMGGVFNHINNNLYHYAANNPVKYTDPNGMEDDIPSFEELNNQYEKTLDKFLRLCDISDNFSDTTSLITTGKNKIEDVLSGM